MGISDIRRKGYHRCKIVMDDDEIKAAGSSLFPRRCSINNQPFTRSHGRI
jgi:hypothetical protein